MSARKRCGLLSLFIDIRRLILHFGSGPKCRWSLPGRNVARKRCGLLSLFIDIRRLICILGAGQNADGVSREEMSPGKDVGCCLFLLISDDSSAFWERAKCRWSLSGRNVARKRCGLLSLFIDTRGFIRILRAGKNADGVSREEMSPGKDVGCCLSLLISDDSSAFWERAKMQMESPGEKRRPGRDVGCCLSLLISDDSYAFWERAKMQMESPGTKCRPGRDVGCCLSLLIPEDSYAFWERATMQMESPGKKCRQEEMWAAVSLY